MAKTYKEQRLANFFIVSFVFFWGTMLALRFYNFGYYDWDLAFFAQAMWQLAHGSAWSSLFGINFFSNHANLIAVVLAPFYAVFPHPLFLLFLKVISVAVAGWVIFRFAQKKVGGEYALWVLLLFFFYTPNVFGILYEFDMEALVPGILALAFYFYYERRWKLFMLMAIFALLIKENIPLVIMMFGLYGLLTREAKWKWGWLPLVTAIGMFFFMIKGVIPYAGGKPIGSDSGYIGLYAHLGGSLTEVFRNILFHPIISFQRSSQPGDLLWVMDLFGTLLFLPFFKPAVLILIAPIFAQHFFSSTRAEHTIFYGYALTMAPFIFLSLVFVLGWVRQRAPGRMFLVMSLLVILGVVSLLYHWPGIAGRYSHANAVQWNDARRHLLDRIGPQEPVIASFCFLPSLANRKELYAFHKVYAWDHNPKGGYFMVPANVRWALIDLEDGFFQQALRRNAAFTKDRVAAFFKEGGWVEVDRQGPILLLKRDVSL